MGGLVMTSEEVEEELRKPLLPNGSRFGDPEHPHTPHLVGVSLALAIFLALPYAASALSAMPSSTQNIHPFDQGLVRVAVVDGIAVRVGVRGDSVIPADGHGLRSHALARTIRTYGYRDPTTIVTPEPPRAEPVARSRSSIEAIIVEAALRRGADPDTLVRVAKCESGLRPDAVGDHGASLGLYQFHRPSGTWAANAPRYGWYDASPFAPYAAADVAAAMFAEWKAWMWTCAE